MRRFGQFAVHEDSDFLQQLNVAMTILINDALLTDPAFQRHTELDREMLLMNENTRTSVKSLAATLSTMRSGLEEQIMGTGGAEYVNGKLKMLSIVDDVMSNIADNQKMIADAKKALTQLLANYPDKKSARELLQTNTADVVKFRHKLHEFTEQVKNPVLQEQLKNVLQGLPDKNINMHGLDKEKFEMERRVGKGSSK